MEIRFCQEIKLKKEIVALSNNSDFFSQEWDINSQLQDMNWLLLEKSQNYQIEK